MESPRDSPISNETSGAQSPGDTGHIVIYIDCSKFFSSFCGFMILKCGDVIKNWLCSNSFFLWLQYRWNYDFLVPARWRRSSRVGAVESDVTSRPALWSGAILPTVTSAPPRPCSPGDRPDSFWGENSTNRLVLIYQVSCMCIAF